MKHDISIYVRDIIENMERAEKFVERMDYAGFAKDEKTYFAVMRCIEIMIEAEKHIPESIRQKYPEISWKGTCSISCGSVTHLL